MNDSMLALIQVVGTIVVMALTAAASCSSGIDLGRCAEQRDRLREQGCEQIASEPELWECPNGERVEVTP